jgi:hypothetical protein
MILKSSLVSRNRGYKFLRQLLMLLNHEEEELIREDGYQQK